MDKLGESIKKHALANAVKFDGRANPGAIIGKIIGEFPDMKNDMKGLSQKIGEIVKEINSMKPEAQLALLQKVAPESLVKKEKEERDLPPLKNAVDGKVVTRMPPEPSKYNHLGHAMSFLINYLYAKKYNGKCFLRFDDTNPEKESQEYVDAMKEDTLEYLGVKPDKIIFASEHMDKYYEFADKLVNEGHAYVCSCKQEDMGKLRREMVECAHRNKSVAEEKRLWEKMKLGDFEEGECVLRLKINMAHKNAVMRDPAIYRLCYTSHYKQGDKYKVWPLYDFETTIEEGLNGITHVLRSNEFDTRIELQNHIAKLFGFPEVEYIHYGRYNVVGATTQGREIRAMIESGNFIGWDDPRLVTLKALKRRGITRESFYELAKSIGLSKNQTNLDYSVIAAINRQLLDKTAERYFFLEHPVPLRIEGAPKKIVKLNKHPHDSDHGRVFHIDEHFFVERKDLEEIEESKLYRLMDAINFKKEGSRFVFVSEDLEDYKKAGKKIMHWLPKDDCMPCEMMNADATVSKGLCEKNASHLKEGAIIQFERYGFARLDKKESEKLVFWFGHK